MAYGRQGGQRRTRRRQRRRGGERELSSGPGVAGWEPMRAFAVLCRRTRSQRAPRQPLYCARARWWGHARASEGLPRRRGVPLQSFERACVRSSTVSCLRLVLVSSSEPMRTCIVRKESFDDVNGLFVSWQGGAEASSCVCVVSSSAAPVAVQSHEIKSTFADLAVGVRAKRWGDRVK